MPTSSRPCSRPSNTRHRATTPPPGRKPPLAALRTDAAKQLAQAITASRPAMVVSVRRLLPRAPRQRPATQPQPTQMRGRLAPTVRPVRPVPDLASPEELLSPPLVASSSAPEYAAARVGFGACEDDVRTSNRLPACSAPAAGCVMMSRVVDSADIATHAEPAGRQRANFIVRLDLAEHGMPGKYEQMWTRADNGKRLFELCCIPFFPYGQSLGDILEVDTSTGAHRVHAKSGHQTIRLAFLDDQAAHTEHASLHKAIAGELGCKIEFRAGNHYAAIDLPPGTDSAAVIAALAPLARVGALTWEWADPPAPEEPVAQRVPAVGRRGRFMLRRRTAASRISGG